MPITVPMALGGIQRRASSVGTVGQGATTSGYIGFIIERGEEEGAVD